MAVEWLEGRNTALEGEMRGSMYKPTAQRQGSYMNGVLRSYRESYCLRGERLLLFLVRKWCYFYTFFVRHEAVLVPVSRLAKCMRIFTLITYGRRSCKWSTIPPPSAPLARRWAPERIHSVLEPRKALRSSLLQAKGGRRAVALEHSALMWTRNRRARGSLRIPGA